MLDRAHFAGESVDALSAMSMPLAEGPAPRTARDGSRFGLRDARGLLVYEGGLTDGQGR